MKELQISKIVKYLRTVFLQGNPSLIFNQQSTFIMLLYFSLETLDVLNRLSQISDIRQQIVDFIYSLQVQAPGQGGFLCSHLFSDIKSMNNKYNVPHIVFSYSALNCLCILGEDLSRLNKKGLLDSILKCKQPDGSFSNFPESKEADLRFVYAAVAMCKVLGGFQVIDKQKTVEFIKSCSNIDGGFGLRPGNESHCGAVYCAVASLHILGELDSLRNKAQLVHFIASRQTFNTQHPQIVGIQGRVGKLPDSCYSFWASASLQLLINEQLMNPQIVNFLQLCVLDANGLYRKFPQTNHADPLHTLHSIVGRRLLLGDKIEELCLEQGIKSNRIPPY